MNKEVLILVGVSGSGKSTFATQFIKDNPNYLCINRDDIRKTLVGNLDGYYQRKDLLNIENIVTSLEDRAKNALINRGYGLVSDNTNLKQGYIKGWIELADYQKVDFKFKLFDISLEEAKNRVLNRDFNTIYVNSEDLPGYYDSVKYIDKQWLQYQEIKKYLETNYKDKII